MRIGLPRELKDGEYRVALSPGGAAALARKTRRRPCTPLEEAFA